MYTRSRSTPALAIRRVRSASTPGRSSTSTTTTSRSREIARCEIASECLAASACGTRMWSSARSPGPMQVAAEMFTPASLMAAATSARAPGVLSMSMTRSTGIGPSRVSLLRRANREVALAGTGVATAHVVGRLGAMTDPSVSLRLARGPEAPRRARAEVVARFRDRLEAATVYDVALVVSELVTNSVNHPGPRPARELGVEVGVVGDHVLIAVSDRGAQVIPRSERRSSGEKLG